jgi:regulatory protein YycI of two-component signal transduction system YycFG
MRFFFIIIFLFLSYIIFLIQFFSKRCKQHSKEVTDNIHHPRNPSHELQHPNLVSISVPPRKNKSNVAITWGHSQASSSSSSTKASKKSSSRRYSQIDEVPDVDSRHVMQRQQVLNNFKKSFKEIYDGFQVLNEQVIF